MLSKGSPVNPGGLTVSRRLEEKDVVHREIGPGLMRVGWIPLEERTNIRAGYGASRETGDAPG